jgi:ubiquinone/menaquinone biosynthesis C-methylase UbiE
LKKEEKVQEHFNKVVEEFDQFYTDEKPFLRGFTDKWLRGSMQKRWERTMQLSADIKGKSVLDIGCGTGRYSITLARNGAGSVIGIDVAPKMIGTSTLFAKEAGVSDICSFKVGVIEDFDFGNQFDLVLAQGLFDYIFEPESLIKQMKAVCRGTMIASFPKRGHILTPQRKVRYMLRGCPIKFYSHGQLRKICESLDMSTAVIEDLGRDFLLIWSNK